MTPMTFCRPFIWRTAKQRQAQGQAKLIYRWYLREGGGGQEKEALNSRLPVPYPFVSIAGYCSESGCRERRREKV